MAFAVEDARGIYAKAVERGAVGVREPWEETDEHGTVTFATVQTYGDTTHTFVDRSKYNPPEGVFLPGFGKPLAKDVLLDSLAPVGLNFIDHCVGNQPDLQMVRVCSSIPAGPLFCRRRLWIRLGCLSRASLPIVCRRRKPVPSLQSGRSAGAHPFGHAGESCRLVRQRTPVPPLLVGG